VIEAREDALPVPSTSAEVPGSRTTTISTGEFGWLLADLLRLVRDLLRSDTATVLLLDVSGTVLETAASVGPEDVVLHPFRVPVGHGFAGTVAERRHPATITEVTRQSVVNPHLVELGIQSLLGAPLVHDGRLLGVVHVGSLHRREFTDAEVVTLVRAAEPVAHTLASNSSIAENALAAALQRTLIPETPPRVGGLELAGRYVPADGKLGGDWYDVLVLPDRRVGLVIGDVAGHGLEAAVVMGRLRSALRAYALEHADPGEVLTLLDTKLHVFEDEVMATVLYAVTEPPFTEVRMSSAGHLAPMLAAQDDRTVELAVEPDPPLGVDRSVARRTHRVAWPSRSALCLFTDGLVERRPPPGGAGVDQLAGGVRRVLDTFAYEPADLACARVLDAALSDLSVVQDDIALLVARPTRRTR
jgi:serine phosphatase RsbU (regulator of sigma subunit)